MSYEDQLISESTGEGLGYPEPDDYNEMLEVMDEERKRDELELDKVESFSGWLDAQGDALEPADSFTTWLNQSEDSI